MCNWMVNNAATIIDILTTTATSRPKARKANGAVKKRTTKAAAANARFGGIEQQ